MLIKCHEAEQWTEIEKGQERYILLPGSPIVLTREVQWITEKTVVLRTPLAARNGETGTRYLISEITFVEEAK